jgi:hypothetical protein
MTCRIVLTGRTALAAELSLLLVLSKGASPVGGTSWFAKKFSGVLHEVEQSISAVAAGSADFGLRQPAAYLQRVERQFSATACARTGCGSAETS